MKIHLACDFGGGSGRVMAGWLENGKVRLEEIHLRLSDPETAKDSQLLQKLMRDEAELSPIAEAYRRYRDCRQTIEDSLSMLEEESDEEMRAMLKEELSEARAEQAGLENDLKVLLLQCVLL